MKQIGYAKPQIQNLRFFVFSLSYYKHNNKKGERYYEF